ncbi:MAG TPA: cytochrome c biogenesis protein CcdA [Candidatus Nanoarchaeia archaeon]|nr:cytochrome c biogenesis protein CcdA [Candidatus Nanoarchaeia archaeon]
MAEASVLAAFIGGLVSFLSPCVLPLIPGFLAYLSGTSLGDTSTISRMKMFLNSIFFVLGFSLVFALLGVLLNTILQSSSYAVQTWLGRLGGLIIIIFGLYLIGLIKIPFLQREHKLKVRKFSITYVTSFVFGAAFAVGWSPCVGAVLGSVLALAISQPALSFWLLLTYSIGLGIPFLLVGFFSTEALNLIKKSEKVLKYFNIIVGILLIILGILVFTNNLNLVANFGALNWFLLR